MMSARPTTFGSWPYNRLIPKECAEHSSDGGKTNVGPADYKPREF
jgi:hypothetical protein